MTKTPDEIRAEIKAARDQLTDSVRGLSSEVHPSIIKQRTLQHIKETAAEKTQAVKAVFVDDAGVRWDRIGTVVLLAASVLLVQGSLRGVKRLIFH
ncbi:MAG: DUF3618 domain-containing protein [Propionibacteriaceae bacterium]|nr:DUF3618 domain-containing protein [Propionibacteriaceae bacterium]